MIKRILSSIAISIIIFTSPFYSQNLSKLNRKFDSIPQFPINNTDANLIFKYKYTDAQNPFKNKKIEKRAEELNEIIKKGKYFHIEFKVQLNCSGYDSDKNAFNRLTWNNIEKNRKRFVFEIKTEDKVQEEYGDLDSACSSIFLNMSGIIGMYNQLLFPEYASEKTAEEYLKQDWMNFNVEILFNTFETAYPSDTHEVQNDNPHCPLIVPYAIRVKKGDAVGVYFLE